MAEQPEKDQKTEEATARRREEAREKGQVALSQEFVAAVMLAAGVGSLLIGGGGLARSVGAMTVQTVESLGVLGRGSWSVPDVARILEEIAAPVLGAVAVVFLPVVAVGLLVGYGQVGLRVTPKAVAADLSKIDPIKGFGRLFSARSAMRTVMALAKIVAISAAMAAAVWTQVDDIIRLGNSELGPALAALGRVALRGTGAALVAILALSLADLAFQRFQHERDLRMSKQEVREEHKTTEGDPHVKAKVRQIQREMATRRMMEDVPSATVVVTNPTHFAVALRYEREAGRGPGSAPVVVAKGRDRVALRIRELATDSGVVCYEDPPLARALYAQVEIGDEIPEAFYAAVATVLSYVYRLQAERS